MLCTLKTKCQVSVCSWFAIVLNFAICGADVRMGGGGGMGTAGGCFADIVRSFTKFYHQGRALRIASEPCRLE
jgi:hypothetical protein